MFKRWKRPLTTPKPIPTESSVRPKARLRSRPGEAHRRREWDRLRPLPREAARPTVARRRRRLTAGGGSEALCEPVFTRRGQEQATSEVSGVGPHCRNGSVSLADEPPKLA